MRRAGQFSSTQAQLEPNATARVIQTSRGRFTVPRPLRGMILIDGTWQIRHAGFLSQRELTCWNNHRIHTKPEERPIEGVVPCGYRDAGERRPCPARLFVFRTRARLLFAMDITQEEDDAIELGEMDLDDIIEHFGLSFPERVRR